MTPRTTARLRLDAVGEDDVDDLFALSSDPAVWTHLPSGRHVDRSQTEAQVADFVTAWERDGLGYWTARRRDDDVFVGVGGATIRLGVAWNLYYRFAPAAQGQGYATDLAREARAAAAEVRPDLPVTAYLLEHNVASRKTAERVGLDLVWRGPDAGNPDPSAIRLVFADRPLSDDVLSTLTTT